FLMREALSKIDWPEHAKSSSEAFVSGFSTCAKNRNMLAHSNLAVGMETPIALYKTKQTDETTLATLTLEELRRVADDIYLYYKFGLDLTNAINARKHDWTGAPILPFPWPQTPAAPFSLPYRGASWLS